jgi:catechol 2,3-dioxygenase-like lactoylglutathione lyase family enzyme
MSRLQLALNVPNLEEAISFYSTLFQTEPAKVRPGYANFAIVNPPLKLVLMESGAAPGSINHLGIEVESTELVANATELLQDAGLATEIEESTTCCYAVQDKVWVGGPDTTRWEVYCVLADASDAAAPADGCCVPETVGISLGRTLEQSAPCC